MSHILALDIGTRRTGIAYGEMATGIVVALDTIHHASTKELTEKLRTIVLEKRIDMLIVGLPKLPQGQEGSQAVLVREAAKAIEEATKLQLVFLDERFSSLAGTTDPDARAACELLGTYIDQHNKKSETVVENDQ